jgi:peptidyl-prolyl cis-trans isomerase C
MTQAWQAALAAMLAMAGAALAEETAPAEAPSGTAAEAPAAAGTAAGTAAAVTADTVVATVNGTAITLGQMIVLRESLAPQYQALPDEVLFNGILEQLVQQEALEQSVEDRIGKRDLLAIENDRRSYLSNVALRAVVESAVTDAALQAAYDARFKDAAPQTEYNAAHILVDSEAKAKALRDEIDGGADFAELARANSSDGSAANGGDLGWFGLGMMVKPFEDAVVALKPGEVGGPIETQFGWHLVKLIDTRIADVPTLDDVREELAAEIENAAIEAHVTALVEAATVERPGAGLDPAVLRDGSLLDE